MKVHVRGPIVSHEELAPGYFLLALEAPDVASGAAPGQFIHLLCRDDFSPFLRRPLSLLYAKEGKVATVYKVVGEGTQILSQKREGDIADLVGPLGTTFEDFDHERLLFVAGGIGIVPLVYFSKEIVRAKERVHWVYGASSATDLVLRDHVEATGRISDFSTMDGSYGTQGTVIDILNKRYPRESPRPGMIYACGPGAMLEVLRQWMLERKIPGQFSLENRMGCALGACLGCVLPRQNGSGYVRICCDGPVFDAQEVVCHLSLTE